MSAPRPSILPRPVSHSAGGRSAGPRSAGLGPRSAGLPAILLAALLLPVAAAPAGGGGRLDAPKVIDGPSPFPGYHLAESVPIFHDDRCIPAPYFLNTTFDPLPNPFGAPFLTLAEAAVAIQSAIDSWNDIPTSYIELEIVGTTGNLGFFSTFDTMYEVTFRGGGIAQSNSVTLAADMTLTAGTDIDLDGDPDVAAGIATCADVDGDGDLERPEGFYKAGTILDNDVSFSRFVRWTVDPAAADNLPNSIDLEGVAAHEFGHSVGLAHSLVNMVSPEDGTPGTMYPFADTGDPDNELAMRTLEQDEVGFASLVYPEGTAASGPAALQPGDVAFEAAYGLISGEVRHGVLDHPVAGASVSAVDRITGETVAATYSGESARFYNNPATFDIIPLPGLDSVLDGRYQLPVPHGVYDVRIEAMDDFPVPGFFVSYVAWVGYLLGIVDFPEEAWNWLGEGALEAAPNRSVPLPVHPGWTIPGIDFTTNRTTAIENFGSWDWVVYQDAPPGGYYAVQVPGEQVLAAAGGERFALTSADFFTYVLDNSALPLFAEAMITTGRALPDGTAEIDLDHPLVRSRPFLAQEFDFAPLYPPNPTALGQRVENGIRHGWIDSLFLVLRLPDQIPYPGFNGFAPVIGIDGPFFGGPNDVPVNGLSYRSLDGQTFVQDDWNYLFRLTLTELP